MNTIRAVNQAIGRVIRHINDYGTIFLIDERYNTPRLKNGLSGWVHKSLTVVDHFDK
jgi:Rad3-related DNA helicase